MKKSLQLKLAVVTTGLLFSVSPVFGFKIDTHVWVGQQVYNDLADDGRLSLELGSQTIALDVESSVKNAILNNRQAFLMGNIGPDASPDAVVGQTVIHPGLHEGHGNEGNWQTADWLNHLLNEARNDEKGKAFAYGYLGHAAADVFAHTYVNQYAGDVFNLEDEMQVEKRHFILESFIGKHTPPLKDHRGNPLGSAYEQVTIDDELAIFIKDALIRNDQVQAQYQNAPYASHLVAYDELYTSIHSAIESGFFERLDGFILGRIVEYYTGYMPTSDQQLQLQGAVQNVKDEIYQANGSIQAELDRMLLSLNNWNSEKFSQLHERKRTILDKHEAWVERLLDYREQLSLLRPLSDCRRSATFDARLYPDPLHLEAHCDREVEWHWLRGPRVYYECTWLDANCVLANEIIEADNRIVRAITEQILSDANEIKRELIDEIEALHRETTAMVELLVAIKQYLEELMLVMDSQTSPTKSTLMGWRQDLNDAMVAYVKAAGQSMINTMNAEADPWTPMVEWVDCYHLPILGVPSQVSGCGSRQVGEDFLTSLENSVAGVFRLFETLQGVNSPFVVEMEPLIEEFNDKNNRLTGVMRNKLIGKVKDEFEDVVPANIKEIIDLFNTPVTDDLLNSVFTQAEVVYPPKGLIMIPDMAARVKSEMNLRDDSNYFDPERYAVIYNAVVLAKLALLGQTGLTQLAEAAGVGPNRLGISIFDGVDNVVSPAFANIDGNHQWMPVPPPIPNAHGEYEAFENRTSYATDVGFLLWDDSVRNQLFRSLFVGPLSPGMDSPDSIGMTTIPEKAENYPYEVCSSYPYPRDDFDKGCRSIRAVPGIMQLLL